MNPGVCGAPIRRDPRPLRNRARSGGARRPPRRGAVRARVVRYEPGMRAMTALVIRKPGRVVIPEIVLAGEVVQDEPRRWWQPLEAMFRIRPASDYRMPLGARAGALLDVYG